MEDTTLLRTEDGHSINPSIMTIDGRYFDFVNPWANDYDIETIAHALSLECRFGNHCKFHYSVAQHSVLVSHLVPPEFAFHGLMHDAHEAFVGDMTTPLKVLLPDYKALEKRVQAAVLDRFGLPREEPPEVTHADRVALATEKRDVMNAGASKSIWTILNGITPDDKPIRPMSPQFAKALFLLRYAQVAPK